MILDAKPQNYNAAPVATAPISLIVTGDLAGLRLDQAVASLLPELLSGAVSET